MTPEQLSNLFSDHAPTVDQTERINEIREAALALAQVIVDLTPASAEQTLAIRQVHGSMKMAELAIACNE